MTTPLEFWFDFASTYTYPTVMRIEKMCRNAQVELLWRPILLGPIFRSQGWQDSPFNVYPIKGQYMWRDLERLCEDLQIPLRRPSTFPRNGLLAARIACWYENEPWLPEFVRQTFTANFAFDRDISHTDTVAEIINTLDLPTKILAIAESPEAKLKLRSQTERATSLGIFGAPSFTIGSELFWGNDRLETAVRWAKQNQEKSL